MPKLKPPTCATHPHVILRCLACAGAKGGRVSSPKKTRAARRNARLQFTPSPKQGA